MYVDVNAISLHELEPIFIIAYEMMHTDFFLQSSLRFYTALPFTPTQKHI